MVSIRKGLTIVEMATVILVISVIMGILISIISSLSILNTSEGEAEKLAQALSFARRAAVGSNQPVYFEIDIDSNSYEAYRIDRSPSDQAPADGEESEVKKNYILNPYKLGTFQSIVKLQLGTGSVREEGKVLVPFSPYAEDFAVFIGSGGDVAKTVHYRKYLGKAAVMNGEQPVTLEKPSWREDLTQ